MFTEARRRTAGRFVLLALVLLVSLPGNHALGQARLSAAKLPPGTSSNANISLEVFLNQALRNHPEILAAEAEVQLAQAELTRTRFQITRELIVLWNTWQSQSETVQALQEKYEAGVGPVQDVIAAKGKLTEAESQLSYLLGRMRGTDRSAPAPIDEGTPKRLPQGPLVEKVLEALDSPTELEFIETPIQDVANTLMDFHEINFVNDPKLPDLTASISVRGIPLGAALQALEDITLGVRFVVCDYGILVTPDDSHAASTYISANELWREQLSQEKPSTTEPPAAPQPDKAIEGPPLRAVPPPVFSPDPFGPGPGPAQRDRPRSDAGEPGTRTRDPFLPAPGPVPGPSPDGVKSRPGSAAQDASPDDPFAAPPSGSDRGQSQSGQGASGPSPDDPFAAAPPADN